MSTELLAVDVLSDEHMLRILHYASRTPVSLPDLCTACDISGAACFRRVSDLKRMGLLKECPEGDTRTYSSSVRKIELQFKDGLLSYSVEMDEGQRNMDCIDPITGLHPTTDMELRSSGTRPDMVLSSPSGYP